MATPPIVELRNVRLRKLEQLRELGFDPYPPKSRRSNYIQDTLARFDELTGTVVTVAGRLMSLRAHGALSFAHLQDMTGKIQLYLRRDEMREASSSTGNIGYQNLGLLDVGDFIEATGVVMVTQKGERSIGVQTVRVLAKSLRPLPEKRAGVRDREAILRRRYLDTTATPDHKDPFEKVSLMLFAIREFLAARGFLEFNTPVLQPQYGGGSAKPFKTHVNALRTNVFLAISHELYLKRLIAAGFDRVFTIGRYFRNEGMDSTHHPEFSMVETMSAYENYEFNMTLVEDMFKHVAVNVFHRTCFNVCGHQVDLAIPWRRTMMVDAVKEVTGVDFGQALSISEANGLLSGLGITESAESVGHALVRAFEERVQPTLIQPTLVYGHPVEISPLAKAMPEDSRYAERFEIFIGGLECGDNWSEQNDPLTLLRRWTEAKSLRPDEGQPLDYDFLEVLEHGMPPTTGIGPGIERMAMIFNETQNIDDVIFFPLMRPSMSDANQAIYGAEAYSGSTLGELALPMEALGPLISEGVLEPEGTNVSVELNLKIWRARTEGGLWRAYGFARLIGFLAGKDILITGYQIASQAELSAETEARKYADHMHLIVQNDLQRLCSSTRFIVAQQVMLDEP
ncbi:MAG: lysine--tRNA ligase [Acidobacteria bacterium]|nr:MAG: lysine--tRNA ligase [Acidobacteriota bacterium]